MNTSRISQVFFISFSTLLAFSSSAQAASFTTNFNYSLTGNDAYKGDIWLNSITQKNGNNQNITFTNFSYVKSATIISNDKIILTNKQETANPDLVTNKISNNNTGAASTDAGDKASLPKDSSGNSLQVSGLKDPTGAEIAAYLGNNNLNNIIDTEDSGSFRINLFFDQLIQKDNTGLDNLFFWERGMNSDLKIQALDKDGTIIGNSLTLYRKDQKDAGYIINTTEINNNQKVGSWGVSLQQFGANITAISGIQVTANKNFSGPDFKVIARTYYTPPAPKPKKVPEPATTSALVLFVVGALGVAKKNSLAKDALRISS